MIISRASTLPRRTARAVCRFLPFHRIRQFALVLTRCLCYNCTIHTPGRFARRPQRAHIWRGLAMFGRRPDGRRIKGIDPVVRITPYIMPMRCDAQVFLKHRVRTSANCRIL